MVTDAELLYLRGKLVNTSHSIQIYADAACTEEILCLISKSGWPE
jgi:hypothetical protein